ncbi:MAG: ABC-F family ATP-binding cassette domain-containing protein [Flavobacteriales bacterium]|nr:ABC-F family ATP-binding cassette domain-containing protein [Flavobacteriales bacterium]
MNILSVENISKRFGEREIFRDLSFGLSEGQKVALIAKNGAGKSTLLKALADVEPPDEGKIVYRNNVVLGYVRQESDFNPHSTILEAIFESEDESVKAIKNYEMALTLGWEGEKLQKAIDRMDELDAWDSEVKARQILTKLKLDPLDREIRVLSGGEVKRLSLAQQLIKKPDVLLLDEPTNHLDLDMIEWLEDHLINTDLTLLMITHDRYFLERVCDVILELDNFELYKYKGNYSYFLEKKELREEMLIASTARAKSLMKTELDWIRRQPKARGTKAKYRVDQFDEIKKKASVRLDKEEAKLEINISRIGSKIVELHNITKGLGDKELFKKFSYVFKRNDRVGIIGRNGSGKSTFLNMITGTESVDTGKIVIGDTVKFGYYTQSGLKFKDGQKVIEAVREIAEVIPLTRGQKITAAQLLERFLFPRNMHHNHISKLSGGEKRRLYLLTVLMQNPNFLILDEPTNDLDIFTLQILENYLAQFPGVLLIVSHDRYFMDRIVEHTFVFNEDKTISDFPGNYTLYRIKNAGKKKAEQKEKKAKPKKVNDEVEKVKLTYAERLELEKLDKEIEQLEKDKFEKANLLQGTTDYQKIAEISTELESIQRELEEKTERWMFLADFEQ